MKSNCTAKGTFKSPRVFVLLFLVCGPFWVATLFAQITLSLKSATMGQAIESIQKQTNYNFFYDDQIADVLVSDIQIDNGTLQEALTTLLKNTRLVYTVEENIVYLSIKADSNQMASDNTAKTISGTVVAESGEPLIGVSVIVKGMAIGTTTDFDGRYTIDVPIKLAQLEFSYIGYHLQTVSIGNNSVVNVTMREDTQMINEVVVTALGIKREKRLLGYSIQEIKGDDLNRTGNATVTGALQGKVAGVQMNVSPTGLNGSTKITIRGNSSLTDNNQPLWIVDGIPFGDSSDSSVSLYGGIDRGGASIDINPEDIESISVLKGPNAAALYGSRAGNGVIFVTTKKGTQREGLGINYNSTFTWTKVAETLDMQTKYGQGSGGAYSKSPFSYGVELGSIQPVPAWWKNDNNAVTPYSYNGNKLQEYFNTGFTQNHNLSIGNVTEDSHYRVSVGYLHSKGLFENESLEKYNVDLNSGKKINKFLSMESKVSLSKTRADNRPFVGLYGEMFQLLYLPNNISLSDLKTNHTREVVANTGEKYGVHQNWIGPDQDYKNPYWLNSQRSNMDERWRAFGYHSMKVNITKWLVATGKLSIDYYRTKIEETDKGNGLSVEEIIRGDTFIKQEQNFYEMNAEFMILGHNTIAERVRIDYGLGGNTMYYKNETLAANAQNMAVKGVWYLNNAGQETHKGGGIPTFANQYLFQKQVNSLYGTLQVAFDDYISLDVTGRNDWSSTLPAPHSYFYPSFSLSFIGTEFINKMGGVSPRWLTFAKMRASYAKAGKDTDPYSLLTYQIYNQSYSGPTYSRQDTYVDANFKPEMNTSYEIGLEMKFLNNRLGFDFTYYNSVTNNQIMLIPNAGSSGFNRLRINAGSIQNRGVEFALYTTPIRTKNFEFGLDVNMAHNRSVIKKLHPARTYVDFGDGVDNFFITVGGVEGGALGDIYAKKVYQRDDQGNLVVDKNSGLPKLVERTSFDDKFVLGNIQPKLLMSVAPRFSYKNFTLSALFDMKFGGEIVSVTEASATHYGTALRTIDRNEKVILEGVYLERDGTYSTNKKEITKEEYYRFIGDSGKSDGVPEEFVYNASYIKFRELAFGYSLSRKALSKTPLNSLRVSFVARDLGYLLKYTPGTSPEGGFNTNMYSQAFDFLSTPNSSTIGFSVNLGF